MVVGDWENGTIIIIWKKPRECAGRCRRRWDGWDWGRPDLIFTWTLPSTEGGWGRHLLPPGRLWSSCRRPSFAVVTTQPNNNWWFGPVSPASPVTSITLMIWLFNWFWNLAFLGAVRISTHPTWQSSIQQIQEEAATRARWTALVSLLRTAGTTLWITSCLDCFSHPYWTNTQRVPSTS